MYYQFHESLLDILKVQYVDVICVNRYFAWYSDCGHTELIQKQMEFDLRGWFQTFNKPVLVTEYGADTIAGLHQVIILCSLTKTLCPF